MPSSWLFLLQLISSSTGIIFKQSLTAVLILVYPVYYIVFCCFSYILVYTSMCDYFVCKIISHENISVFHWDCNRWLKLQYFGHLMWSTDSLEKTPMKDRRQEEKGTTENEMVGWHLRLDGHELEQAPGVGDGQGSLVCYSPRDWKESDMAERLNWIELNCKW